MGSWYESNTLIIKGKGTMGSTPSLRNLSKNQLGGVIFGCNNTTLNECHFKQLFGLPAPHYSYVKNIDPGLPLFLFNYSDKKLHGIYEAASSGQMNIDPYGWTTDGSQRTLYPAQVQIRVRQLCHPEPEERFKSLIVDNYFNRYHFWFELDHAQTSKLLALLSSSVVSRGPSVPVDKLKWKIVSKPLIFPERGGEGFEINSSCNSDHMIAPACLDDKNRFLENLEATSKVEQDHVELMHKQLQEFDLRHSAEDSSTRNDVCQPLSLPERGNEGFENSSCNSHYMSAPACLESKNKILENSEATNKVEQDHVKLMHKQLQELDLQHSAEDSSTLNAVHLDGEDFIKEQMCSNENNDETRCTSSHCQSIIAQLNRGLEELRAFKNEQSLKMHFLEQTLVKAEEQIQQLKCRCSQLESMSSLPLEVSKDTNPKNEILDDLVLDPAKSIYLVGGYDGKSWLSALDLYSPSFDALKSLKPMTTVRSYASIVNLNEQFYVLGGGEGNLWFDSVESYNPATDQWSLWPSFTVKKGSLGGATLNGKIFAVGGGNGSECFSDVEMLDLDVGRWIPTRSMLQKRFALASVEYNGVIYATGGFNGSGYLKTAERFDPREHSWAKIASMNTTRGSHSLVVLNEKLYALGGFDGVEMVASTEIYEPRMDQWMNGDPMKTARGYSAAVVIDGCIYVIGGVESGDNIVDTVGSFKETWQETTTTAIGKRCFLSALVL